MEDYLHLHNLHATVVHLPAGKPNKQPGKRLYKKCKMITLPLAKG